MSEYSYYSLTTKKKTLRCNHYDWLEMTQELYNQVLFYYYQLYLDTDRLWGINSQQCLRELEKLTVVGRDKKPVPFLLPWKKLPLYFRRAAINAALCAGKSYRASQDHAGNIHAAKAVKFHKSVTFYKGMYKEFGEESIELKVWNGKNWEFLHCRLSGKLLPDGAERLSPSVVIRKEGFQLHIPVKEPVNDGRKAKERIQHRAGLCCIQFTNEDAIAVCAFFDREGNQKEAAFLKGGKTYSHRCRQLLNQLEKSELACKSPKAIAVSTDHATGTDYTLSVERKNLSENRRYWEKLKNVSEYYSNSVSRQIISKCKDMETEIIVLPAYDKKYTQVIMGSVGKWSPLYLSHRIRKQLKYKAWREGILVLEVNPLGAGRQCAVCGASIRKVGKQFICSNGHQGNRHLNAARSLHARCIENFDRQVQEQ